MSSDYQRIEEALRFVEARAESQPSLDQIADHVGLSGPHLQRVFKRWAGVSPKRFLQLLTAERARAMLRESESVLDTALGVGLSGPGRLHDLMVSVDSMTPGEIKQGGRGLVIRHGVAETPFGSAHLALTERGICGLSFVTGGDDAAGLAQRWPGARLQVDDNAAAAMSERVFQREASDARPLTLLLQGTNFQVQVWRALLRIPEGAVTTYGALAASLRRAGAARAVGTAVGANPIAYLIPCHRVLRQSGALGGYRWGTARKRALLAREWTRGSPGGSYGHGGSS